MVLSAFSFGFGGHIADREIDDQGQKPYVCVYIYIVYIHTRGPQNHEQRRFKTPNILVITPKNEGCGFVCYYITAPRIFEPSGGQILSRRTSDLERKCWIS